jgi:dTDP-glucose 4,6-dehydratase
LRNLLITGGAGFIGSNFVRYLLEHYPDQQLVVYDILNYRGNLENLRDVAGHPRYTFVRGDICDAEAVAAAIREHAIDTIVNFAAYTHVDRSIMDPDAFVRTDVYGTYVLLEATRSFGLERFHHISTDEVYGEILTGSCDEAAPLEPRSPYAASKAGGDLLVRAYHSTYNLPVTITRGANNIGPYQYPENFVPLFITNAIDDQPLPLYGDGRQVRMYQYVLDHCSAIDTVLRHGAPGEIYNVGPDHEADNLTTARLLLDLLGKPHSLIRHVADRPGHDRRYAMDGRRVAELGWTNRVAFSDGLAATVRWFTDNEPWWRAMRSGDFDAYYELQYGDRLARAGEA